MVRSGAPDSEASLENAERLIGSPPNHRARLGTRTAPLDFYTPGVARVCVAMAKNPADAGRLTIKRNTVAVVIDGSAVLGLGNIGPAVAMPVLEDKAAPFKQFGKVQRHYRLRPQRRNRSR